MLIESSVALSAAMDFYLAVYPGFVLAKLQMKKRKKLPLMGALSIGMIGTVVAAYKCTRLKGLADPDFSCTLSVSISRIEKHPLGGDTDW